MGETHEFEPATGHWNLINHFIRQIDVLPPLCLLQIQCVTCGALLVVKVRSTLLLGLGDATYSQALSRYCSMRALLPAAFPPWASTCLTIEPGAFLTPP